ncbi:hypothetical protein H0H93_008504 [Arthromyces matolae]|nr:hypothetical protein H0H93_008504 [Arthromyces matolae]
MKYLYPLILSFTILTLISASPAPGLGDKSQQGKGKGRAVGAPPSPSPPKPPTPTPENDPSVPLPGRTDVHTDPTTQVSTLYYGDDKLPEHMGHLQRNQAQFPHNRNPMSLSSNPDLNRANALRNVPSAPNNPMSNSERVRDEKMPAMLHNPHHATSTTVEYLDKHESNREGSYTGSLKSTMDNIGPNAQAKLRPNPGWLPLHPDQHRGHEAPAQLKSQTKRSGAYSSPKDASLKMKESGAKRKEAHKAGYTPQSGSMTLRHREGKADPKNTAPTNDRKVKGESNLRPGYVLPPGQRWKPSSDGSTSPSHAGAPAQPKDSNQRQPPRPQDHDHYVKQIQAKKDGAKDGKSIESVKGPRKEMSKYLPKESDHLKKFNEKFGPAKSGDGAERSHEAPAIMDPHSGHQPKSIPQVSGSSTATKESSELNLPSRPKPSQLSSTKPGPKQSSSKQGSSKAKPKK